MKKLVALALMAVSTLIAGIVLETSASTIDCGTDCDAPGGLVTLPIDIVGAAETSAVQFDIVHDATALTLAGDLVAGSALDDHVLDWNDDGEGTLRVLIYSPTSSELQDGTLFSVSFAVEDGATPPVTLDLPPITIDPTYDGPGMILANVGAIKSAPDPEPTDGVVEIVVISQPVGQSSCIGGAAVFSTYATYGPNTYQWKKDGTPIPGATAGDLMIPVVEPEDMATYGCDITNQCGSFSTDTAAMTVYDYPCAPGSLRVYDPGTGSVLLADWDPNPSSHVDAYRLYRGTDPGGPYTNVTDLPVSSGTSQGGLTDGTRYYFKVSAFVTSSEGDFSNESHAVPTAVGFDLPQAPDYGYQTTPSNDTAHPDLVTYRFPSRAGDVEVWYQVYDVDSQGEVAILLNGQEVLQPAATPESDWSSKSTVVLPNASVRGDSVNVLTFDNLDYPPTVEMWGARQVSIMLPAPEASAHAWNQTVDLHINQSPLEPTLEGYDIHRGTSPGFTPSPANRIAQGHLGTLYRDDDGGAGLVNDQTYYYVVRPMDTIANRGFDSEEDVATPNSSDVTPVMDLRLEKSGAADIQLAWSPVTTAAGVQHYVVYEGATPGSVGGTGTTAPGTTAIRTGEQSDGLDHYYTVKVVDNDGHESSQ
jgi:hypothetical protein